MHRTQEIFAEAFLDQRARLLGSGDRIAWPFTIGLLILICISVGFQYGIKVWKLAIFDALELYFCQSGDLAQARRAPIRSPHRTNALEDQALTDASKCHASWRDICKLDDRAAPHVDFLLHLPFVWKTAVATTKRKDGAASEH
nr:hypothetical protein [Mesorhizobium sp.]